MGMGFMSKVSGLSLPFLVKRKGEHIPLSLNSNCMNSGGPM